MSTQGEQHRVRLRLQRPPDCRRSGEGPEMSVPAPRACTATCIPLHPQSLFWASSIPMLESVVNSACIPSTPAAACRQDGAGSHWSSWWVAGTALLSNAPAAVSWGSPLAPPGAVPPPPAHATRARTAPSSQLLLPCPALPCPALPCPALQELEPQAGAGKRQLPGHLSLQHLHRCGLHLRAYSAQNAAAAAGGVAAAHCPGADHHL
jgi:hypothetical protein